MDDTHALSNGDASQNIPSLREMLKVQGTHFMAILEHMSDGLSVLDREWRYLYVNHRIEEMAGKKRSELLGKNHWELYPEAVDTIFDHKLHQAMEQQISLVFEALYPHSNRWYLTRVSPAPGGLVISYQETTAQKQREKELLFQAQITYSMSDALIVSDMHYIIRSWNPAAEHIYGWKADEVIGKNALEILTGSFQTGSRETFLHEMATRDHWEGEVLQQHRDGSQRLILASVSTVKDHNGVVLGMVAANRDITEIRRIDLENLRLLEEIQIEWAHLRAVLDQMPSGVIIAEAPTGQLLMGNRQMEQLLRHPFLASASIEGYTKYQGFHPDGRPYQAEEWPMARSLRTGEVVSAEEIVYQRGDGTRGVMQVSSAPVRDEQGEIVSAVVIFADITEQKAVEQRKDEFIGMASHELRTPLTSLKAQTQLLRRTARKKNLPEVQAPLAKIEGQINRLERLITELLDVAKIQTGRLESHNELLSIDPFVHEMAENFQEITPTHRIIVSGSTNRQMTGDRQRLEQVLINLLSNAVKYSPQADRVEIQLSTEGADALIQIHDHGDGISHEHVRHIFERFYRVTTSQNDGISGLGIGLYIADNIVKQHGGMIRVASISEEGSTFTISLPTTTQ
ncbi:hypothetical protein KDH_73710 [Dictyobacter sp. S3.2.2.5]|uniref:histidine kinase n=1 Tax=Dictyobacter halimunensis TaxID=3026934 RepID=A0ABQ6G5J6_9CHLR|nr:hypothetical protein KDH_73710 [Dictyobacter sp. S3.2.2.5]